jgi:hypothetical protein
MNEELFNIISHKGNANQNITEIPSNSSQPESYKLVKQAIFHWRSSWFPDMTQHGWVLADVAWFL